MFKILMSPLSYLRIKHEAKYLADWIYPILFSFLSALVLLFFGIPGAVAGKDGLLSKIFVVSSVLPGFYIAALAAIATFNRPDIDDVMAPPTPEMKQVIGGRENDVPLTRRRFLTYLFSFLCFESISLMIICVFSSLINVNLHETLSTQAFAASKFLFAFFVLLMFWQMICGTVLGLYYIGDRLYRPY